MGQVKSVDGATIQLSTAQDVLTVVTDDQTQIQKMGAGALSDVTVGERITVQGTRGIGRRDDRPEHPDRRRPSRRDDRRRAATGPARGSVVTERGCQPAGLVAVRETGLMSANMLRAFQVGKALTSDGEPSSWMRPSPVAWAQVSWPACHLTKASASAVM